MRLAMAFLFLAALISAPGAKAAAPGQPFASYWHPASLLAWSPATDPDAPFNRSNTPLAATFINPALNVNSHARLNEARVVSLVAFASTSGNPSQGGVTMPYYAPNYWQYMHELVFWGGSASEGIILAPNPTVIDSAHRNGVPVLGNVFFPPTAYGGQFQWVTDFLQKSGSTFPVADKLIQVAQYYGFDGWFLNQETAGGNAATATAMRDFIKYIQANSSLRVMWYDAMSESGTVGWQNALTSSNDLFLQDNGMVSDDMFLNFSWSASGLASSRTRAQNLARSSYDLFAGVDVEGSGYNKSLDWSAIFPETGAHVMSLGFYRPEWTRNSSSSVVDFYVRDNRFWVGANRDPGNTATTDAWKGVAHYIPAKSPITKLPFVSNFNTGHGSRFAVNGQTLRTGEWNNLSLQDVLPTWRWIVQSTGEKLIPDFSFSDTYYGGTSLKVSGNITATNDLKLFETSLPVSANTSLRLAYKMGASGVATSMQAAFSFEESPTDFHFLDLGATTSAGWNTKTFGLGAFAGKKLAVLGLRFQSANAVNNYTIRVGQIAVYNGPISSPAPPSLVVVDGASSIDATTATARLKWTHSPDPVYYYNVYRRNPDNSRTWLGATPNNAYFVPEIKHTTAETFAPIEIETVGMDFGTSAVAAAKVFFPVTFVSTGAVWKYNDSGANLGTAWRAPSYNDAAWLSGISPLGYGDNDEATRVEDNSIPGYTAADTNRYITTYFRRSFTVANAANVTALRLAVQRDDGVAVYLNGQRVFLDNLAADAISTQTADSSLSGADESAYLSGTVDPALLIEGNNVLAVEIHQSSADSSDISFDLLLDADLDLSLPTFTISPTNKSVIAGWPISLGVSARGAAPLTYRWQKNGQDIPGALASTLQIPTATTSDGGSYRAIVTNNSGSATSAGAIITVVPMPIIKPPALSPEGATAIFTFTADAGLTYDIEESIDLISWSVAQTITGQAGTQTISLPAGQARHFYRLKIRSL
ncbi:MAG: Mannosyl-glycoprotein endo-beta-N-acetylglucosaminidase [Chthoniobacteraceae bacterium]|nr:Mannosyl-glycoprotein endo-beta-N-acetylglucosaminidase [Chthoniobacteraceae bacterium]